MESLAQQISQSKQLPRPAFEVAFEKKLLLASEESVLSGDESYQLATYKVTGGGQYQIVWDEESIVLYGETLPRHALETPSRPTG